MLAYIVRRTLLAGFTVVIISFVAYLIVALPEGDALDVYLYEQYRSDTGDAGFGRSPEELWAIRELWGLNDPLIEQWWGWVKGIVQGDFGYSIQGWGDARTRIVARVPYTIYLGVVTIGVTWIFAIPIGIYSAVRQHSVGDYIFTFAGFSGLAIPDFLLGLVMMYVFFAYFGYSVGGIFSGVYEDAPWSVAKVMDMLQHLIIPAVVLGTAGTAGLIRIMRNNLLDELGKPYVVTARAKGLVGWKVIVKYPVRVAINPFISGIGSMLPGLVSGSVIVSVVLGLPTLGPLLLQGIMEQEMDMVGTIILMLSTMTVIGTLISDLMLVVVDPRIKLTGSGRTGG